MNRYARIALAAAVAAVGTAHAASAQLPVIPYGPVETGLGINVAANYAKPTGSGASGSAWGISAGLGLSRLGISASFGGLTGGGSTLTTFGGMAGLKLFGGGLTPVEIGAQVGANAIGSTSTTSSQTNILPGAWVKISPPLFPLKPWAQVYDQISNNPLPYSTSGSKSEVRFAVGANFNLLLGLGVHAGYDFGTGTGSPKSWGIGAHMNFRVPSLGVPGM